MTSLLFSCSYSLGYSRGFYDVSGTGHFLTTTVSIDQANTRPRKSICNLNVDFAGTIDSLNEVLWGIIVKCEPLQ